MLTASIEQPTGDLTNETINKGGIMARSRRQTHGSRCLGHFSSAGDSAGASCPPRKQQGYLPLLPEQCVYS
jgi:hypothetical protein